MKNIVDIITNLKKRINDLENKEGLLLIEMSKTLSTYDGMSTNLENLWVGGWGQTSYDHYRNPKNQYETVQVNSEFFYDYIKRKFSLDIKGLDKTIGEHLEPYKNYQLLLVTELSIIKGVEMLSNEVELLDSIENFEWGTTISDYIKVQRPGRIMVTNMHLLSRGIEAPPHFVVIGHLVSLSTQSYSVKIFQEQVNRLLRQIELKLSIKSIERDFKRTEEVLNQIFENFHSFHRQLRNRHAGRATIEISDEYDVQDLLHAILRLHFKDVREEEYTPSYAGSSTRMDFLLKNENIVIEVKKTRERLTDKEIGEQLTLDVAHYKNHPNCSFLKCFVYDPENRVKNPRGIESDINKLTDEKLSVELYIRP